MADKLKLGLAALLVIAGVIGYYMLAEQALLLRTGSVLLGLILAAAVAWASQPGKDFIVFSKESIAETRKVVWPTRKETIQTTLVVIALVVVVAVFLWVVDAVLLHATNWLMNRG